MHYQYEKCVMIVPYDSRIKPSHWQHFNEVETLNFAFGAALAKLAYFTVYFFFL